MANSLNRNCEEWGFKPKPDGSHPVRGDKVRMFNWYNDKFEDTQVAKSGQYPSMWLKKGEKRFGCEVYYTSMSKPWNAKEKRFEAEEVPIERTTSALVEEQFQWDAENNRWNVYLV
jgi:hypothetical protein